MSDRPIALVTGASAGIGAVYARALAARGRDLVLVARSEGSLKELADELHERHRAETEVLPADLTLPDGVRELETRLGRGDVELLVNNAGFGTYGRFDQLPVDAEEEEIRLNVLALVRLSHAALGPMVERGRGAIVNVASLAAYLPGPEFATYAATKAFVLSFSESLMVELRGTGVTVQALCPGFVRTGFQQNAGMDSAEQGVPRFLWLTPEQVVDASLRALGRGSGVCVPDARYKVGAALLDVTPRALTRRASALGSRFL